MTALSQPANVSGLIGLAARAHPDREAIVAPDIRLSYDKVWQIGKCFAQAMHDRGMGRHTTVALQSRDMIASVGVMIATGLIGARFILHSGKEAPPPGTLLLHSPDQPTPHPDAVLISPDWSPRHAPAPADDAPALAGYAAAEDPWWALQTSGTTGRPKTLWLSHRVARDRSLAVHGDFRGAETRFTSLFACNTRPFFVRAMAALINGATIVDGVDPAFLAAEGVNLFSGSPRLVQDWRTAQTPTQSFPRLQVSGAPLRAEMAAAFLDTFDEVEDVYGSGETNKAYVTLHRVEDGRMVRIGKPQDSEVQILDAAGQPCAPGIVGTVRIRNGYMAPGYADAPEATARAFRDGWFYPGDLASWSATGALDVVGRVDQLLNLGGVKVDPVEVEDVLHAVPGVAQAAVFLDPTMQNPPRTMAFLQIRPGHPVAETVQAAIDLSGSALGGLKAPGYIYVVPEIPMTHDGVPRRAECARIAATLARGPVAAQQGASDD